MFFHKTGNNFRQGCFWWQPQILHDAVSPIYANARSNQGPGIVWRLLFSKQYKYIIWLEIFGCPSEGNYENVPLHVQNSVEYMQKHILIWLQLCETTVQVQVIEAFASVGCFSNYVSPTPPTRNIIQNTIENAIHMHIQISCNIKTTRR